MFWLILAHLIALLCIVAIVGLVMLYYFSSPPNLNRFDSEKYFLSRIGGERLRFPSIEDKPTIDLSIIVPSYNEEKRLPIMMDETLQYLEERQTIDKKFSYEVIVVDDGSSDKTSEVALTYTEKYSSNKVRVLTLQENRGKGGAVRLGMFSARGDLLLFADADGASKFSDLERLETEMEKINSQDNNLAVVCGSRAHLEEESIAERSLFRTVLMHGFHMLVWLLCVRGVKDTQCGFKLFTRPAAHLLFSNLHVERWAFDVDMLHIAQKLKLPVSEVGVTWTEIDGSKMTPVWSWLEMGKDLILIRLRYMLCIWTITDKVKTE